MLALALVRSHASPVHTLLGTPSWNREGRKKGVTSQSLPCCLATAEPPAPWTAGLLGRGMAKGIKGSRSPQTQLHGDEIHAVCLTAVQKWQLPRSFVVPSVLPGPGISWGAPILFLSRPGPVWLFVVSHLTGLCEQTVSHSAAAKWRGIAAQRGAYGHRCRCSRSSPGSSDGVFGSPLSHLAGRLPCTGL